MNNNKNIVNDNPPAKLQLTAYDQTISWEVNRSDLTTDELVEAFYNVLVAHTFNPLSIIESMKQFIDDNTPKDEGNFK